VGSIIDSTILKHNNQERSAVKRQYISGRTPLLFLRPILNLQALQAHYV